MSLAEVAFWCGQVSDWHQAANKAIEAANKKGKR